MINQIYELFQGILPLSGMGKYSGGNQYEELLRHAKHLTVVEGEIPICASGQDIYIT